MPREGRAKSGKFGGSTEGSEKVTRFFGALMILGRVVGTGSGKDSGNWRADSISNGGGNC